MAVGGIAFEITDLKKTEKELQRYYDELTESNTELARFAYVASHDLKEPLRNISNYSQLLAKRYRGNLDERADQYIEYITLGVGRMYELIDDLLLYSSAGNEKPQLKPVAMSTVVAGAQANVGSSINDRKAVIETGPLPTVVGDPVQLTQLFQNLLSNAVKYCSGQSPHVRITYRETNEDWVFSVADNGIGIAPEYHKKIFDLFQRLHAKEPYSGTGIGLAVCKKIVERHRGKIWVESEMGKGSTFCFSLPKNK